MRLRQLAWVGCPAQRRCAATRSCGVPAHARRVRQLNEHGPFQHINRQASSGRGCADSDGGRRCSQSRTVSTRTPSPVTDPTTGVNHGGQRGRVRPEFRVGDANAHCPADFVICFKLSSTRLLALQCSKKRTNPIILTEYSLLSKGTPLTSTKSPLQAGNFHHFSGEDRDKIPLRMHQNTPL